MGYKKQNKIKKSEALFFCSEDEKYILYVSENMFLFARSCSYNYDYNS